MPKDKYEKLLAFVKKIYVQLGSIVEGGLQMPLDEATGSTLGFAFVNFASREEAEKAIAATNNWNFDKAHALKVGGRVRDGERWLGATHREQRVFGLMTQTERRAANSHTPTHPHNTQKPTQTHR